MQCRLKAYEQFTCVHTPIQTLTHQSTNTHTSMLSIKKNHTQQHKSKFYFVPSLIITMKRKL